MGHIITMRWYACPFIGTLPLCYYHHNTHFLEMIWLIKCLSNYVACVSKLMSVLTIISSAIHRAACNQLLHLWELKAYYYLHNNWSISYFPQSFHPSIQPNTCFLCDGYWNPFRNIFARAFLWQDLGWMCDTGHCTSLDMCIMTQNVTCSNQWGSYFSYISNYKTEIERVSSLFYITV